VCVWCVCDGKSDVTVCCCCLREDAQLQAARSHVTAAALPSHFTIACLVHRWAVARHTSVLASQGYGLLAAFIIHKMQTRALELLTAVPPTSLTFHPLPTHSHAHPLASLGSANSSSMRVRCTHSWCVVALALRRALPYFRLCMRTCCSARGARPWLDSSGFRTLSSSFTTTIIVIVIIIIVVVVVFLLTPTTISLSLSQVLWMLINAVLFAT
jgi:hypothetical protein